MFSSKKKSSKILFSISLIILLCLCIIFSSCSSIKQSGDYIGYNTEIDADKDSLNLLDEEIILPKPRIESDYSLEKSLQNRRSIRNFSDKELELEKISQLLWAAQGITKKDSGYKTTPSAGALYPLEIFLAKTDGVFHYVPEEHKLEKILSGDLRIELAEASVFQGFIAIAPITIIITGVFERTTEKYGERGIRYIYMEAGHCGQNILLQAVALDLGAVPVGAFDDEKIQGLLKLPAYYRILYIIPIGYPG